MIDQQYGLADWVSPQTKTMLHKETKEIFIEYHWQNTKDIYIDYLWERFENLWNNFNPEIIWVLTEYLVLSAIEGPGGTFSMTSPLFTAFIPTTWGASLTGGQLYYNIMVQNLWAHGNVILLLMQAF